jgi:hypothetical protein
LDSLGHLLIPQPISKPQELECPFGWVYPKAKG